MTAESEAAARQAGAGGGASTPLRALLYNNTIQAT